MVYLAILPSASAYDYSAKGQKTTISAGQFYTAIVDATGDLWLWGAHPGSPIESRQPIKIMNDVISVSCGDTFVAALKSDGSLWTWGKMTAAK